MSPVFRWYLATETIVKLRMYCWLMFCFSALWWVFGVFSASSGICFTTFAVSLVFSVRFCSPGSKGCHITTSLTISWLCNWASPYWSVRVFCQPKRLSRSLKLMYSTYWAVPLSLLYRKPLFRGASFEAFPLSSLSPEEVLSTGLICGSSFRKRRFLRISALLLQLFDFKLVS